MSAGHKRDKSHHQYNVQLWGCVFTLWYDAIVVGFLSLAIHALLLLSLVHALLTAYQPNLFIIYVIIGGDLIFAFASCVSLIGGCVWRVTLLILPWIISQWFHLSVYVIGGIFALVETAMEHEEKTFGSVTILTLATALVIIIGIQLHFLWVVHLFLDQLRKSQVKASEGFKSFKINL